MCYVLWFIRLCVRAIGYHFFCLVGGVPSLILETKAEKITMQKSCRELDSVFRRYAFISAMMPVSFKRAKSGRSVSTRDHWN
jgi:hypothetical protein